MSDILIISTRNIPNIILLSSNTKFIIKFISISVKSNSHLPKLSIHSIEDRISDMSR